MRIKVKLRPLVTMFHLEKVPTRKVFEADKQLEKKVGKQVCMSVAKRYPTLKDFQEADKVVLVSMAMESGYEAIKEAVSKYVDKLFTDAANLERPEYLLPVMQAAYGKMSYEAGIYFQPFSKIQEAVEALSDEQQKFLNMYYGFIGEKHTDEEIKKELKITVPIEEYKRTVLSALHEKISL